MPPEDRAALSAALLDLLDDEDARRRLGAAARARSAAFAPEVVVERWEALLEEVAPRAQDDGRGSVPGPVTRSADVTVRR